ncbi:unnamed protein product [Malus baccata var. baccata]
MSAASSVKRGRGQQKHYWTTTEDTILRADTGFKNGYLGKIEAMMEAKLLGCGLKASPHIESHIKTLKEKYFALTELLALSGFEWNEEKMMACEKIRLEDANANQNEGQDESGNDFDISFSRARVGDEMAKEFSIMAKAIADVGPKLDGLVHALKMEFLSPMELFQVTNFLAKEHDLMRVFFNMSDERKSAYVTTLLQTWMHNDV